MPSLLWRPLCWVFGHRWFVNGFADLRWTAKPVLEIFEDCSVCGKQRVVLEDNSRFADRSDDLTDPLVALLGKSMPERDR